MDDLQLLIDLHKDGARQGPGSEDATCRAIELAGLDPDSPLAVADIGCGTGASTLALATHLNARITAVDLLPDFLEVLAVRAAHLGLADRITPLRASMDALPLAPGAFDVVWSEGAIYNIGFAKGVRDWRRLLKPGGVLVVSELTWLTGRRPDEIRAYWEHEYPGIDLASSKMRVLEDEGYSPIGYFVLPGDCWLDHYDRPLEARFPGFLERHGHSEAARAIVAAERREITLYERYRAYFGYGFYVARSGPE